VTPSLPLGTAPNMAFDNTWPAMMAGAQSKTRRKWTNATARRVNPGMLFAAWDAHYSGSGRHFGWVMIDGPAPRPDPGRMPSDWVSEGWEYFHQHPEHIPIVKDSPYLRTPSMVRSFRAVGEDRRQYTVRFAVLGLTRYGLIQAEKLGIELPPWLADAWPGDPLLAKNHWGTWARKWTDTLGQLETDEAIRAGKVANGFSGLSMDDDPRIAERIAKLPRKRKTPKKSA